MHYKINILCLILLSIFCQGAKSETSLNVTNIPVSLKENAYAVVRYETIDYNYESATRGIEKHTLAITILDQKGENLSQFIYPGDKFRSLISFTGKMYDASGKLLKKYKLSDVNSSEWSSSLATDAKNYSFSCATPFFPFTIVYEYEIKWNDGILTFPTFIPQRSYNLSVEKASYQLVLPENMPYRSKTVNMPDTHTESTLKGTTTHKWMVENLAAIEQESFDTDLLKYVPTLYTCPQNFIYDKVAGSITSWESYGNWSFNLIKNRDILPDATKSKLIEMTKKAETAREKVKILYDYLGETTHYVSIQLGIGGFQPMLASEVDKTKFGDCKGLSNYMKAMLSVVGIPSNYCIIRLDPNRKTFYTDYPNFIQPNHIVLQVPLPNDTLWLECTNPNIPFGYIHDGISGHDVVVCTSQGGKLTRVPDYADSLNVEQYKSILEINPDGSAKATVEQSLVVKKYESYRWFCTTTPLNRADALRGNINLPNVTMGTIQFNEDKSPTPSLFINYTWSTKQYGTKTENRLFIPINPFRNAYNLSNKTKRLHDVTIDEGYRNIDSISIRIPEGFVVESIPYPNNLNTPFGSVRTRVTRKINEITIIQEITVYSGKYNKSYYSDFVGFNERIRSTYKGEMILRKQIR